MQAFGNFGFGGMAQYGMGGIINDQSESLITQSAKAKYPNPFCDIASEYMPNDIYEMFNMAEYLWMTMPPFAEVGRKVVSYFVTDFDFEQGTQVERKDIKKFLDEDMKLKQDLIACGIDLMIYGQVFVSVYVPFKRMLVCPECKSEFPIEVMSSRYKFHANPGDPYFSCKCPKCDFNGRFNIKDHTVADRDKVRLIRWNPKHMSIAYHPVSGRKKISLDFSRMAKYQTLVKEGNLFYIKDTPWDMIKAICAGSHTTYEFNEDKVYHMAGHTISGLDNFRGWAIPPLLSTFKLAYYIQLLRRYDEAFVLDFIIPFRVMYPKLPASGPTFDPLQVVPMDQFVSRMRTMVERKRRNITDIQVSPFEIGYSLMGGEAKVMSPKDNIDIAMRELLNASGYAAEMYEGNLQLQTAPVAFRIFERRWIDLVDGFNYLIDWVMRCVSSKFEWSSDIKVKLRSVTLADDLERKALGLEAAAGGDISKTTAYAQFGIDFREEQEKVLEEQALIEKLLQEAEAEREVSQLAGDDAAMDQGGGMPGGAGDITMDDIRGQAQDEAAILLFQVPESQRRGKLKNIKDTNPTLHALVLQAMNEIRQDMASQGKAMLMEQERQAAMAGQKQASDGLGLGMNKLAAAGYPSPSYIRLLILSEANNIDREYMKKVAMDTRESGPGTVFTFICRIIDPTRDF